MHKILDLYKTRLYAVHIICAKWGGDMTVYGYARVSTDGQSLSAQLAELKAAKCEKIFQEKISGARSDRKQLARLMAVLTKGDVLVVTRLDRLARSTRDLLNLLGTVAEKGAGFKSLRDTWADTTTAHGRLMLTVLGGLAEFERELIRTRTGEDPQDERLISGAEWVAGIGHDPTHHSSGLISGMGHLRTWRRPLPSPLCPRQRK
jgi:Resolvase, N terminal domain